MSAADGRPRWGTAARGRKAQAIWLTLREFGAGAPAFARWLDVGCGSGGIAAGLAAQAGEVLGVDPEPWPEWSQLAAGQPNLSFREARFDQPQPVLPAQSFDVAVCNQVYEHVGDPFQLLRNIHHVLRPGGLCYFAGPNLLWPVEPHVFWPFVHWLPRRFAQRLMRGLGSRRAAELDAWSAHYWTLQRWFRASGFRPRQALAPRLAAEFTLRGQAGLARIVRRLPVAPAAPLVPGFVFVLVRQ